ncbi:uncharacterized protein LOC130640811 [Hydractinia symbiolongicarpus]|uniref:uncharacterized protein LOC130640811 n=1 Tax=Hydractinia symbiolongicarpus TaxID=13093 RepID=UPI00254FC38A|nr:uncharacterized protein LOC130640811 [Hydractinia symbiolongicarpus]XP_057303355.1 uncharacterized protein LOC130640811 [Hydractinia symbiolongicarpus]XP_057303356.1 uncharacterized protein LOC130640811 [Hydractinia symbiolongicarpus]XP_057303357.1 uncharacterized protein LOC130640811 [Hydractinia symbiolongicarpus]XP_057303358.1 uncharacterized protein LOC130640811 [Hydractinia symbiolongicarpus]
MSGGKSCGDSKYLDFWEKLKSYDIVQLVEGKSSYHSDCYKMATNKTEIDRLKKRPVSKESSDSFSPSFVVSVKQNEKKTLRSSGIMFQKHLCIICQKRGGKIHKVMSKTVATKMLEVSKLIANKSFFIRMNNIPNADAIANDAQYHLACWVKVQREALALHQDISQLQNMEDTDRALADVEIINIIKHLLGESHDNVISMNDVNYTYNNLMGNSESNQINYKRYLKHLLTENIEDIVFSRPPSRTESERNRHEDLVLLEREFRNCQNQYTIHCHWVRSRNGAGE